MSNPITGYKTYNQTTSQIQDLSGIFQPLSLGFSYPKPTGFTINGNDLNTIFAANVGNFITYPTQYWSTINNSDLSNLFAPYDIGTSVGVQSFISGTTTITYVTYNNILYQVLLLFGDDVGNTSTSIKQFGTFSKYVNFLLVGGGAGGGGGMTQSTNQGFGSGGGGGGGGGYIKGSFKTKPNITYTITAGKGGTGTGNNNNIGAAGNAGNNSSISYSSNYFYGHGGQSYNTLYSPYKNNAGYHGNFNNYGLGGTYGYTWPTEYTIEQAGNGGDGGCGCDGNGNGAGGTQTTDTNLSGYRMPTPKPSTSLIGNAVGINPINVLNKYYVQISGGGGGAYNKQQNSTDIKYVAGGLANGGNGGNQRSVGNAGFKKYDMYIDNLDIKVGGGGGGGSGTWNDWPNNGAGGNGGHGCAIVWWPVYDVPLFRATGYSNIKKTTNYTFVTFTDLSGGTISFIGPTVVNYLIVGGGGAGGASSKDANGQHCGGGGASGDILQSSQPIYASNYVHSITVGSGGTSTITGSTNGTSSSFGALVANGGNAGTDGKNSTLTSAVPGGSSTYGSGGNGTNIGTTQSYNGSNASTNYNTAYTNYTVDGLLLGTFGGGGGGGQGIPVGTPDYFSGIGGGGNGGNSGFYYKHYLPTSGINGGGGGGAGSGNTAQNSNFVTGGGAGGNGIVILWF